MDKRPSAAARVFATLALAVALVAAIVVIGSTGGGDDSTTSGKSRDGGQATRTDGDRKQTPATYVVESGDTLTSIARETGVSVTRIQVLNPSVDPQILLAGEELELR